MQEIRDTVFVQKDKSVDNSMQYTEVSATRLARLRSWMAEKEIQVFFVRDTSNIAWLSAFEGIFDSEQAHALIVTPDTAILHTDSRYAQAVRSAAQGGPIQVDDAPGKDGRAKTHETWFSDLLSDDLGSVDTGALSARVLALESSMALGEYRKLQAALDERKVPAAIQETEHVIANLRAVKDTLEVEKLRAAQAIADAAFAHMASFIEPGMTERQVQIELDGFMRAHGASDLAFPSIVACGPNGANPHAQPGDATLQIGQCVVMDFGAKRAGYCSDMTRMVCIGKPSEEIQHAYAVLRQANEEVEAMLVAGITGKQAHEHAEQVLADGGYAGRMGHGLGHGVGMDVHEDPVLAPRNEDPLVPGNVVTVEPGIYIPGQFGMRLEDFGVITDEGFNVFTQTAHDLVII